MILVGDITFQEATIDKESEWIFKDVQQWRKNKRLRDLQSRVEDDSSDNLECKFLSFGFSREKREEIKQSK